MASYTIKHLPHSQCQLVLTQIAEERLQKAEKKTLQEYSRELKIPGFRQGHIPEEVVRSHIQEGALKVRAIELAFPEEAHEALQKEKLRLVGSPQTEIESIDPLKIVVTFDVYPSVKIGNYQKISVTVQETKVDEKQVEEALLDKRKRMSEFKDVDRAAKKGDRVEIDFEGFDLDGKPLDNTKSKNHPIVLGNAMLIPGFEDEVMGMKKGEEKSFEITFPKDYHVPAMASKLVRFAVTLQKVQEVILPKVDDAFIEKVIGKKMPMEDFKKEVRAELVAGARHQYEREYEDAYYKKLLSACEVDPPVSMIEGEKENILRELKQQILYSGGSFEAHLERIGKTEATLLESYTDQARERVSLHLILQALVDEKKIEVDELEVEEEIKRMTANMESKRAEQFKKSYSQGSRGSTLLSYQLKLKKLLDDLLPFKQSV